MPKSSVALHRLLRKARFPLCWIALVAGLGVTDQAVEAETVGPFGTTASYLYGGFLSDYTRFGQVNISKGDTASSLGFTDFRAVAVSDQSVFSGPLGTNASATVNAFAVGGALGARMAGQVDAVQAMSAVSLRVGAKASLFDIFTVGTPWKDISPHERDDTKGY